MTRCGHRQGQTGRQGPARVPITVLARIAAAAAVAACLAAAGIVAPCGWQGAGRALAAPVQDATQPPAQQQTGQAQADDLPSESSGALEATVPDLINADISLDETPVTFTGEAVTAPVYADAGHKWVTIGADGETISVYMRNSLADAIKHFGSYGETGDIVRVSGTFYLDCETHEGDVDVHAIAAEIVFEGKQRLHAVNEPLMLVGLSLIGCAAVACIVFWRMRERQR